MSPTWITYILLLFPTLIFLLKLVRKSSGKHKYPLPPSPPMLPIIGNLHQIGLLLHRSFHALSAKYGPIMLLQLGNVNTLVVSSPKLAEKILKTHDVAFASRPNLKHVDIIFHKGYDVVVAPYNEQWREARKHLVTHLLSIKMVQSYKHVREQEVQILIDNIYDKSISGSLINMSAMLNFFSFDMLCRVVCGKFKDEAQKRRLLNIVQKSTALLVGYNLADFFPILRLAVTIGLDNRSRKIAKMMDVCIEEIIKDHADRLEKDGPHEHTNFTEALILLEKNSRSNSDLPPFTDKNIKALLVDAFSGGVGTSFVALEWSMKELLRNPKSMKRLQDEVRSVGSSKKIISEEDLKSMNFLKAVIKESLRLHPPGPLLIPRESKEDVQLAGYHIPKKSLVFVNAWAIARDPEIWEEAEEFRPERFMNSDIDFRGNNFEYIPFGAGRRICPGLHFSMHTVELALANIIRMFDWDLPKGTKMEGIDMEEHPAKRKSLELYARQFSFV